MTNTSTSLSDDRMLFRENHRNDETYWTDSSPYGIVASSHYRATAAGLEILEKGGNAVDAAVAVSLALGVVEPHGSGLGGMSMMMVHLHKPNRTFALDGACPAPIKATPEEVARFPRKWGYKAIAVPTTVAVLDYALRQYGRLSATEVLQPAIQLAEEGYPVTPLYHNLSREYLNAIKKGTSAQFLLDNNHQPFLPRTVRRQPVLAKTLNQLAEAGFQDFYTGEIGHSILDDMKQHDGFICEDDLMKIPWPQKREPLVGKSGSWSVYSFPPPGGGTTLLQMLSLFDILQPKQRRFDPNSPEGAVLFASIIRRARFDRRKYRLGKSGRLGDKTPDLASPSYAKVAALELQREFLGFGETTHFCVMDRHKNVVSLTQSLERCFGSKMASENLGFVYNGYIKGFKIQKKSHPHYLKPGAVARSNAAPTILLNQNQPYAAIGSTGSERMLSGIFETLVRLRSQSPFQAVSGPRLHCTPEGQVFLEAERFSKQALSALEKKGFELYRYEPWSFKVGGLQLAVYDGNNFQGVADPRRDGAAAGPKGVATSSNGQ
jgi:gamma-glutamyltranspeptidase/glutathione hydrolase